MNVNGSGSRRNSFQPDAPPLTSREITAILEERNLAKVQDAIENVKQQLENKQAKKAKLHQNDTSTRRALNESIAVRETELEELQTLEANLIADALLDEQGLFGSSALGQLVSGVAQVVAVPVTLGMRLAVAHPFITMGVVLAMQMLGAGAAAITQGAETTQNIQENRDATHQSTSQTTTAPSTSQATSSAATSNKETSSTSTSSQTTQKAESPSTSQASTSSEPTPEPSTSAGRSASELCSYTTKQGVESVIYFSVEPDNTYTAKIAQIDCQRFLGHVEPRNNDKPNPCKDTAIKFCGKALAGSLHHQNPNVDCPGTLRFIESQPLLENTGDPNLADIRDNICAGHSPAATTPSPNTQTSAASTSATTTPATSEPPTAQPASPPPTMSASGIAFSAAAATTAAVGVATALFIRNRNRTHQNQARQGNYQRINEDEDESNTAETVSLNINDNDLQGTYSDSDDD